MFIAKFNDIIIQAENSLEELLEKLEKQCKFYTSIEETDIEYKQYNGKYLTQEEVLSDLKQSKLDENTNKAKQAIEDGYVIFKEAEFETNSQTVGDLTATMLMLDDEDVYRWLSKDDKVIELNKLDFVELGKLIAGYKNSVWNNKYISYKEQIEQATTIDELEAIVIDYTVNGEGTLPEEVVEEIGD